MKDKLITYKGGGYDGCFWEWNFFLFDHAGEFVNIFASGRNGITTLETAQAMLEAEVEDEEYFITDLNNPASIKEFVDETNEGLVLAVIKEVNEYYGEEKMVFECPECEQMTSEGFTTGWRGAGGIAIEYYGMVCMDCYASHTCAYCGEYHDDVSELDIDDECHCTYCGGVI